MNGTRHWITWSALLALTIVMSATKAVGVTRPVQAGVLLTAMLMQIALIAGDFMHLRHAHQGLVWTFVAGLLITALLLYVMIVPDAFRIHDMVNQ